jgi:hypothetical protein
LQFPARDLQQIGWETLQGFAVESGPGYFGFEALDRERVVSKYDTQCNLSVSFFDTFCAASEDHAGFGDR